METVYHSIIAMFCKPDTSIASRVRRRIPAFVVAAALALSIPAVAQQSERDAEIADQQRKDRIRDLYDELRELEDTRRAAEEAAQEADVEASRYGTPRDPAAAAAVQANAQAARQNAARLRGVAADATQHMRDITEQIAVLEARELNGLAGAKSDIADNDAQVGTWKLDVARSKFSGLVPKSETEKVTIAKGGLKSTVRLVSADGTTTHIDWTARYDGKDYPVKDSKGSQTISLRKIDDYTIELTNKVAGMVSSTSQVVSSSDGQSRTVTTMIPDNHGRNITQTTVWDKQ
jgi:hypothetical protein